MHMIVSWVPVLVRTQIMSLMLPPPEQYLPPYYYVTPELRLKICRLWNFAIHSIVARAMRMNLLDAKHLAQAILWTVVSV